MSENDTEVDSLDNHNNKEEFIDVSTRPNVDLDNTDNNEIDRNDLETSDSCSKTKSDLLEYMLRNDGSVTCKLCGEVLRSRTHWYRHKYKVHVMQNFTPSALYQCERCLVFFKSRKGYIGHIASKHTPTQNNSAIITKVETQEKILKQEPMDHDAELSIPKSTLVNHNPLQRTNSKNNLDQKKVHRQVKVESTIKDSDWEAKRKREEKLVADIIARVKKECEAQGGIECATRKGYTRRTTVMNYDS